VSSLHCTHLWDEAAGGEVRWRLSRWVGGVGGGGSCRHACMAAVRVQVQAG
jgi:hypothetical protein